MSKGQIDAFTGAYRFLSNFYPCTIFMDRLRYPTVEHAFQAAKTLDDAQREDISRLLTPSAAKRKGRLVSLREDWEEVKIPIMSELLTQKFDREPFRGLLAATKPAMLIEGNWWNDRFWGVCGGVGENWLGRLLMEIRDGK